MSPVGPAPYRMSFSFKAVTVYPIASRPLAVREQVALDEPGCQPPPPNALQADLADHGATESARPLYLQPDRGLLHRRHRPHRANPRRPRCAKSACSAIRARAPRLLHPPARARRRSRPAPLRCCSIGLDSQVVGDLANSPARSSKPTNGPPTPTPPAPSSTASSTPSSSPTSAPSRKPAFRDGAASTSYATHRVDRRANLPTVQPPRRTSSW